MRKVWLLTLIICSSVLLLSISYILSPSPPSSRVAPSQGLTIRYELHTSPQSVVHTLLIPAQGQFSVTPALSSELDTLKSLAQKHHAFAALNGGFFDPVNHKSTSYVIRQSRLVADPRLNKRLMNNPALAGYLNQILNRTEFRRYFCGQTVRYDIVLHSEATPADCRLTDVLGGGPRLLPEMTPVQEGFLTVVQGRAVRDALGSKQPNARSAVGITRDGSIVWVMVAQKSEAPTSSGMSLLELAKFMKELSVEKAMNLDGGSSSSLYYKGKTIYGKLNAAGNSSRRAVKSVLLLQKK
ncbi:MAG: phosphodiester glycosidase family protein [Chroococcidiopsidaceae cyanobacterium CP_BM_RX_35]|nr:phosphodiester glycosidase family protein [Chroococcidiopsidaceae cyanobacterium CP_BM_RX_35]